jgi:NAD(P)-dependent dehydrogenase (short-subunit alcohol dehydrogenase family)
MYQPSLSGDQKTHSPFSVVTGANRGIGLSIVNQLLSQSGQSTFIIAVDLQNEQLERLKSSSPEKFDFVSGDISVRSTSENIVALAKERTGRLDTLILNAGVLRPVGPIADISVEKFKKLFDVNFFALVHTVSDIALSRMR